MTDQLDIETLPISLILLDDNGCVATANNEAELLFGQSRRGLAGRALDGLLYRDLPVFDLLRRAREVGGDFSAGGLEISGPQIKAQKRDVLAANRTGRGLLIAFLPAMQDEARHGTAAGLANFGRILGHEVRNPLAGISGAAQLLLRNARSDQDELLDMILAESRRIERLVGRLSAFELFSAPRFAAVNIHAVLDRVVRGEDVVFGDQVRLRREYDPSLPQVWGDGDHLHEVFQNLVRNACEAVIAGNVTPSKVIVTTRYAAGMSLTDGDGQQRRAICVGVRDNGPGIPAREQAHMFDMFHTTKSTGSGLGLTVASQIVTAHGGQLALESYPGKTEFSVFLPLMNETN